MNEDAKLNEFVDVGDDTAESTTDSDKLEQEQFGPFTLSTPGEWSAKRLGDMKRLITRGKQPTYDDDGIPVINQECIYWDGWHFENLRYLDEAVGGHWKDKYFPQRGDVILNSTGQGTLGRAQVYPDDKRRAIDSHVTLLRTDEELNPYFHRYFLESHLGQALLYSMCVNGSTGQIELSKTRLDLQPVPLPPLPEQRKIATVLYTVDRAIEKTNEIIESTKRVKRGTLQNTIFDINAPTSIKQRFGPMVFNIPKHWGRVRLQDVAELITRGKQPTYAESGVPVINQECIYWDNFHFENIRYLDQDVASDWKSKYFPTEGDVLINSTGQGTLGRAQVYQGNKTRAVDSHVTIVRAEKERMKPGYFRYLLESKRGQGLLHSMCVTGSTGQIELSKSKLQLLTIPLPPVDEQQEIIDTVLNFEESIRKQQQYRKQLRFTKKGLMQDLLSGTVRTTDTNIQVPNKIEQYG